MGDVVQEENLRRQQEEIEVLNSIYEENMILGPICLKHYLKITWTPVKKCVIGHGHLEEAWTWSWEKF